MTEKFGQKFAGLAKEGAVASLRGLSKLGKAVADNAARAGEKVKEAVASNHEGGSMRRCSSGHYFDPARSSTCPLCESPGQGLGRPHDRGASLQTPPSLAEQQHDAQTVFDHLPGDSAMDTRATSQSGASAVHDAPTRRKDLGAEDRSAARNDAAPERLGAETLSFMLREQGIDPVVGWLVCIEGTDRGRDFRIRSERNFIGRANTMDIVLSDESVSRENHAVLVFNPRKCTFKLQPGGSRGLIYLNAEEVLSPTEVKGGDVIEVGRSKLIFVPFANQYHQWNTEE